MAFVVDCSFSAEKRSPAMIFTSLFSSASRSSRLPASLMWLVLFGFAWAGRAVRCRDLQLVAQRARADRLVADEVDLADLRARTFSHRKQDLHAVAVDRRDGGRDFRRIETARQVLALEFLFGFVDERLVVRAALRQTYRAQRFCQVVLFELVDPGEIDLRNGGTFLHLHHHDIALRGDLDVTEEARCIKRANCFRGFVVGERVALLDRQVGEYRTGFNALKAVNPDVLHYE